jgi:hypothetical protein
MAGESPIYVERAQLGHSSTKVTVDIYGHWIPGVNRGRQRPPASEDRYARPQSENSNQTATSLEKEKARL